MKKFNKEDLYGIIISIFSYISVLLTFAAARCCFGK